MHGQSCFEFSALSRDRIKTKQLTAVIYAYRLAPIENEIFTWLLLWSVFCLLNVFIEVSNCCLGMICVGFKYWQCPIHIAASPVNSSILSFYPSMKRIWINMAAVTKNRSELFFPPALNYYQSTADKWSCGNRGRVSYSFILMAVSLLKIDLDKQYICIRIWNVNIWVVSVKKNHKCSKNTYEHCIICFFNCLSINILTVYEFYKLFSYRTTIIMYLGFLQVAFWNFCVLQTTM